MQNYLDVDNVWFQKRQCFNLLDLSKQSSFQLDFMGERGSVLCHFGVQCMRGKERHACMQGKCCRMHRSMSMQDMPKDMDSIKV